MQVARYARVATSHHEKTETIESPWAALHPSVAAHAHPGLPAHVLLDNGGSVAVVETARPETVCGTRPAWAPLRRSSCSRLIDSLAVIRLNGGSWQRASKRGAVSWS